MPLKLHNTLTNETEDFCPLSPGEVKMYHCGPTVYDYAHIGNLRSYVFADILRRALETDGYTVTQVINITDIGHLSSDADTGDDKMVKGLKREGLPLTLEGLNLLSTKYEQAFKDDLLTLNIETPHHFPRATAYLEQEIDLISKLEEKGFAYKASDGIYFDTSKFSNYGRLGGLTPLDESVARLDTKDKRNARDFVLWKLSQDNHMGYESPWGTGFPGWHIECSAMSRELLGQPFDIHTGGIDHIPVHHNNEIAQSEAAYDTPLANFWLHNEFVTVAQGKMAKSEGNFITLNSFRERGLNPLAYRYFLLQSHYRTPTNFTWESFAASQNAYRKLKLAVADLPPGGKGEIPEYKDEFMSHINDDLNTPAALAVVWKLLKDDAVSPEDKRALLLTFDQVLGLDLTNNEFEAGEIPGDVQRLIDERIEARSNGDYKKADSLREEIKAMGYIVEDTPEGQKISRN